MVKLRNPETGKMEEVDDYHYFDESGEFPQNKAKKYFSEKDLAKIRRNTNRNYHSENYLFIAQKIKSKLEKEFKEIIDVRDKIGYLSEEIWTKQYNLSKKLMEEVKKKSPTEYESVYKRL